MVSDYICKNPGLPASYCDLSKVQKQIGTCLFKPDETENDKNKIIISRISIPEDIVHPWELVNVFVTFKNNGIDDMKNIKVTASIRDLDIFESVLVSKLNDGQDTTQHLMLEIPDDAKPGIYYVKITIDDDKYQRTKYRPILII